MAWTLDILAAMATAAAVTVPAAAQVPRCPTHLPGSTKALIFSVDGGEVASPVKFKTDHFRSPRQVTVKIDKYDHPLLVVLSASYATYWNIEADPATELAGVIVFGRHAQAVANVSMRVDVGFSTIDNGKGAACRDPILGFGNKELEKYVRSELDLIVMAHHFERKPDCLPGPCLKKSGDGLWAMLFGSSKPETAAQVPPVRTSYGEQIEAPR